MVDEKKVKEKIKEIGDLLEGLDWETRLIITAEVMIKSAQKRMNRARWTKMVPEVAQMLVEIDTPWAN